MSKVFDLHWRPVRLCSKASFRTTTEPPMVSQRNSDIIRGKNIALHAKKSCSFVIHRGG